MYCGISKRCKNKLYDIRKHHLLTYPPILLLHGLLYRCTFLCGIISFHPKNFLPNCMSGQPLPPADQMQTASPYFAVTMCDQIAVIKNAIMSEGMQHDLVERATPAMEKYKIEMTLQPILRRSLTRSTIPPGTESWARTSVVT